MPGDISPVTQTRRTLPCDQETVVHPHPEHPRNQNERVERNRNSQPQHPPRKRAAGGQASQTQKAQATRRRGGPPTPYRKGSKRAGQRLPPTPSHHAHRTKKNGAPWNERLENPSPSPREADSPPIVSASVYTRAVEEYVFGHTAGTEQHDRPSAQDHSVYANAIEHRIFGACWPLQREALVSAVASSPEAYELFPTPSTITPEKYGPPAPSPFPIPLTKEKDIIKVKIIIRPGIHIKERRCLVAQHAHAR